MPRLYLIRHGQTALNAARTIQWPDTPLNEVGHRQAASVAAALRQAPIDVIVSSDYRRAVDTAGHLREATGAAHTTDPSWRERHFGRLRGGPWPSAWDAFDDPDFDPPGGERLETFQTRIDAAWTALQCRLDGAGRDVALVTHGLVCTALARHLAWPATAPLRFSNASITIVDAAPPWRVVQMPSDEHSTDRSEEEPQNAAVRADRT